MRANWTRATDSGSETEGIIASLLYRPDKRFHFVLTEAALRLRLCPPAVMLGQCDRLVSLSQLPNVRLGIIGFDGQRGAL